MNDNDNIYSVNVDAMVLAAGRVLSLNCQAQSVLMPCELTMKRSSLQRTCKATASLGLEAVFPACCQLMRL